MTHQAHFYYKEKHKTYFAITLGLGMSRLLEMTVKYNWKEGVWTKLADMREGRLQHACQILVTSTGARQLVVSGLYGRKYARVTSTEIYSFDEDKWTSGEPLPIPSQTKTFAIVRGHDRLTIVDTKKYSRLEFIIDGNWTKILLFNEQETMKKASAIFISDASTLC